MLNPICLLWLSTALFATQFAFAQAQDSADSEQQQSKLYELRFYTTNPGKLPNLHARFRDHTMALFEKHGMENIIYWTVSEGARDDGEQADNMLVYIIAHKNAEAREASWKAFREDPEWKKVAAESEKDGKILAKPPRAILMTDTAFSAADEPVAGQDSDAPARLWELRQYNDGPERVPHTVERFAFGEKDLFTEHGMQTVKFWTATDDSAFIYLLAHKDRDASKKSWQGFFAGFRPFMQKYNAAHPNLPRGRGNGSEVRFLVPTDYSPRR